MTDTKPSRIYYLDILRIISIVAVITIHVTAVEVSLINNLGSYPWWVANIFNALSRWGVPIFFMISGALLLAENAQESVGNFLRKRVLRIGIPFLIWSVVYFFLRHYLWEPDQLSIASIVPVFIKEMFFDRVYYHFWFIYVLLTVYLVIPFLRRAIQGSKKNEIFYWLGLWFFSTVIYNTVLSLYQYYNSGSYLYSRVFDIPTVMGYSGYFLLGYVLHQYDVGKKLRLALYSLAAMGVTIIPLATYYLTSGRKALVEIFYAHFTITTPIIAAAVFVLMKRIDWELVLRSRLKLIIRSLSNATFGIFLVHLIVQILIVQRMSLLLELGPMLKTTASIALVFLFSYIFVLIVKFNSRLSKLLIG